MDRKEGTSLKRKNGISVASEACVASASSVTSVTSVASEASVTSASGATSVASLPSYSDKDAGSLGLMPQTYWMVRPSFASIRLFLCAGIILVLIFSPFIRQTANAEYETRDSQTVEIGDIVTMPDYTRVGYTLLGFSESPNATTPDYPVSFLMDSENYETLFGGENSATLYTVWERKTYELSFDANGGEGTAPSLQVSIGDIVYLPTTFSREGYSLIGLDTLSVTHETTYPGVSFRLTATVINDIFNNDTAEEGLLYAFWSPIVSFSVWFIDWDGVVLKTELVPKGANATPPPDPSREGFDFTGWDRTFSNLQADVTVTALYAIPPSPEPPAEPPPEPPAPPAEPPAPPPADDESPPEDITPEAPVTAEPQEPLHVVSVATIRLVKPGDLQENTTSPVSEQLRLMGVYVFEVGNSEVPAFGYADMPVWALLNLLLSIAGIALAVVALLRALIYRKRMHLNNAETTDEAQTGQNGQENGKPIKLCRRGWLIASTMAGLACALLFLLTENISNTMVLTNNHTILHAGIFIIENITLSRVFVRNNV